MADDSGNFFTTSRKGYDRVEVDAFIARKAKEDAERTELIETLESRVRQMSAELTVAKDDADRVAGLRDELTTSSSRAEAAEAAAAEARGRVQTLEGEVERLREQEEAIRLTLMSATKTKDEMLEAAETQLAEAKTKAEATAEQIVQEARRRADELTESRQGEIDELNRELERLERERNQHLIKLKTQSDEVLAERDLELQEKTDAFHAGYSQQMEELALLRDVYQELSDRLQQVASGALADLAEGRDGLTELVALDTPPRSRAVTMTPPAAAPTFTTDPLPESTVAEPAPADVHHPGAVDQPLNVEPAAVDPDTTWSGVTDSSWPVSDDAETATDFKTDAAAEHHEPEPEHHEPEPEHHEPEAEHHEPEAEHHEPEAEHHEPEAEHHEPEAEHHEPEAEHHEPEAEHHEPEATLDQIDVPDDLGALDDPEIRINDELGGSDRASFYSRRSGKLPRLGADASRSALTAALSMRRTGQDDDD